MFCTAVFLMILWQILWTSLDREWIIEAWEEIFFRFRGQAGVLRAFWGLIGGFLAQ